jgi:hypothetical protein
MTSQAAFSTQSDRSWGYSRTGRIASILPIMLLITVLAQGATPVISGAVVNTTNNTLTISGANLLGADSEGVLSVTFAGTGTLVTNETPTSITATLASSPAPGVYPLVVRFFGSTTPTTVSFQVPVGPQTRLLFTFVEAGNGLETALAISNISLDPTIGSAAVPGTCTLNYVGAVSVPPVTTPTIAGGTTYTNLTSGIAPSFTGYVIALCNFKAHGIAFISTLGLQSFTGIPAVVNP